MITSTKIQPQAAISLQLEEKKVQQIGSEMQIGISPFASWMLGVGTIIGSMSWLFHGSMIARSGPLASVAAWLIAAVCTLPLCLIVMELASMFPAAGGPYVYKYYALKRLFPKTGEFFGFLTGWLFWIAMVVGYASMSNGLANMLSTSIWGSPRASPVWFSPIIIISLFAGVTLFNFKPVNQVASVNNLFSLLKFAMALSFAALVLFSPHASISYVLQPISPSGCTDFFKNIASVILLALSGFTGLELTGCTSSETEDATKSVPKAMFMTLIAVAIIYISMCIAVSAASPYVLNANKTSMIVAGTNFSATCPSIAGYLGGRVWGNIFTACVVASIIGCGFGGLMAMARLSYSMAKTELFPAQFATLDDETKIPRYALIFQFWCLCIIGISANLLARSGAFPDAYTFLAETFGVMYAFIALLYGICAVSLRYTDPDMERPYRVGRKGNLFLWTLVLFTSLVWGYAAFACTSPVNQIAALLILLMGVPIYASYRWRPRASS